MLDLLRPGRIHYFDEVLFSQALLGDRNAREIFVEKRLKPLRDEKSGALLDTLEALCDEGFQLAGASRKLGIHISTLRYRLERIETLLDVTLEDQEKRFELQVAIAMLRLMQR
jgi:purine catabolism regulator